MRSKKPDFTAAYLRKLLRYNRLTGVFRNRIQRRGVARPGTIAGCFDSHGYWMISIKGFQYKAHLLAWYYVHGKWPTREMDHRDLARHHNWISNLRLGSQALNNANRRRYRNNKCGAKGVYQENGKGRFRAMIRVNRKGIHLGVFDTRKEAHAAYVAKAQELFGAFANAG